MQFSIGRVGYGTFFYGFLALVVMLWIVISPVEGVAVKPIQVWSYASQINDVDAVNSHWFETSEGVVLVDTQRLLPEAERALAHLQDTTISPVVAIVITHAHTDHYGGLPVWKAAFPNARIFIDETTLRSIQTDARGFITARQARHGDHFTTQAALNAALTEEAVQVVTNGEQVQIGDTALEFLVFEASEAEAETLVHLPDEDVLFVGDLVNVLAPGMPFESIAAWFAQLDAIETQFPSSAIYQGHGPAPAPATAVENQRQYLQRLQSLVEQNIEDSYLDKAEMDNIVFKLESDYPFTQGVGGNTRQEVFAAGVNRVAQQMGATVEEFS